MQPEQLSTKAVDNPVGKGARPQAAWVVVRIDQNLINIFYKYKKQ